MQSKKTSTFANGLLWFGAAVSIAEILTGTYLAPLGFWKGLGAIVLGHVIGCALLYMAGLIGAKTGLSAMETVKRSFGRKGSLLFSSLNVMQLVGWTAIMIVSGAAAASAVAPLGNLLWCAVIGALILVWILIGLKNLGKLNTVAMGGLLILAVVLSFVVFRGSVPAFGGEGGMSFGAAVELSVAMPLSWLPLISDYTREAEKPKAATLVSAAVYFIGSCWMYAIGLGAALFAGAGDIAAILLKAGLGIAGLLIIVFSTVTTTFLDAYSAGVSCVSISSRLSEKWCAVAVCLAGTGLAMFTNISSMEGFLYLIGSVFAPMIAIQIADNFLLHRDRSGANFDWRNLILWALGFGAYRLLMTVDIPVGNTLPDMALTMALCVGAEFMLGGKKHAARISG